MIVFNFHHVEREIRQPSRQHISISPDGLRWMIRTLRWLGMDIVSLRDVLNPTQSPSLNNHRQVVFTFDDGYENNYREAVPVLEAEQCPATIFVLPGRFSGTNTWDQGDLPEAERDRLMSLAQMQELSQSPYITFGSHGMLHQHLPQLSDAEIAEELHQSYAILSRELGDAFLPVFAYPWGDYSDRVLAQMAQAPYQYGMTVQTAPWTSDAPPFEIPRYTAYYRDGNPLVFLTKLFRHGLLQITLGRSSERAPKWRTKDIAPFSRS